MSVKPLTVEEQAAVAEAERQGRITRIPSCQFWGGDGFSRMFLSGKELGGQDSRTVHIHWFDQSKRHLRRIERDVIAGRIE